MYVTAVVLCGGQGTRLRPVIGDLPKCLAPVAGQPFLHYILKYIASQGVDNVVLCIGYGADQIRKEFEFASGQGQIRFGDFGPFLRIRFSQEQEPLGTGGALLNALPMLDSDPVLVVNGDTYCPFKLKPLLDEHVGFGWEVTTLTRMFTRMQTSTGVQLLSKSFLKWLEKARPAPAFDLYEWSRLANKCDRQCGFPFLDIGTPKGYADAEEFLREQGAIT